MALGYAQCSVAGQDLKDGDNWCKALVVDGANLQNTVTAAAQFAADGTPYLQTLTPVGGRAFGLKVEFMPPDVLNSIVAAVNAAVEAGDSITVIAEDDINNINAECYPDYSTGWYSIEPQRTNPNVIKNVTFRFITKE